MTIGAMWYDVSEEIAVRSAIWSKRLITSYLSTAPLLPFHQRSLSFQPLQSSIYIVVPASLMFTRIAVPAAPVTLDSFLRIGFRTTSKPPHLRLLTTTPSCARRPNMSHNEAGSDATVQRPKKLICTSDIPTRPR